VAEFGTPGTFPGEKRLYKEWLMELDFLPLLVEQLGAGPDKSWSQLCLLDQPFYVIPDDLIDDNEGGQSAVYGQADPLMRVSLNNNTYQILCYLCTAKQVQDDGRFETFFPVCDLSLSACRRVFPAVLRDEQYRIADLFYGHFSYVVPHLSMIEDEYDYPWSLERDSEEVEEALSILNRKHLEPPKYRNNWRFFLDSDFTPELKAAFDKCFIIASTFDVDTLDFRCKIEHPNKTDLVTRVYAEKNATEALLLEQIHGGNNNGIASRLQRPVIVKYTEDSRDETDFLIRPSYRYPWTIMRLWMVYSLILVPMQ
jgi:hypothetical protein